MNETASDQLNLPEGGLTFEPPLRSHHLTGGVTMLTSRNRLSALMPTEIGLTFFSFSADASIKAYLAGHDGLRHLGSNQYRTAREMNDPVSQDFTLSAAASNQACLAMMQSIIWAGIANTLHEAKRGAEELIAKRVASQVRSSLSRFERLSTAYRTVLQQVRGREEPSSSTFMNSKYSAHIGIEYRAMLNELYGLRDAILAATYRFRFRRGDAFTMKKIKALVLSETDKLSGLISSSMFSTSGDLLIDHMALHRSVAQHCLGASNPVFGDVYQLRVSPGPFGDLLYLIYPLYDNIEAMRAIEQDASKGILERSSGEEYERFANLGRYQDGLEFCYDCFVRLLGIADLLHKSSGIQPSPLRLTERNILELTVTDEAGQIRRKKRNEAGRLEDY